MIWNITILYLALSVHVANPVLEYIRVYSHQHCRHIL